MKPDDEGDLKAKSLTRTTVEIVLNLRLKESISAPAILTKRKEKFITDTAP